MELVINAVTTDRAEVFVLKVGLVTFCAALLIGSGILSIGAIMVCKHTGGFVYHVHRVSVLRTVTLFTTTVPATLA